MTRPSGNAWTFDDFVPGAELGRVAIIADRARSEMWSSIYGAAHGEHVPSGMLVAAMMEAYLKAFQPRPPGNIHAGQKLSFTGRAVPSGAVLDIVVSCRDKALRGERRWVTFGVILRHGGDKVLDGEIVTIWAR